MTSPLRIAIVSAECAPFAKTGGLADVAAALARTLWRRGHDVRLFVPYYRSIDDSGLATTQGTSPFRLDFPSCSWPVETLRAPLQNSENDAGDPLLVDFVNAPDAFGRDDFYTEDDDEPVRWATFARAVLEVCRHQGWAPDVIHANDWHTGLLPLFLRRQADEFFSHTRTLLSIHNLGYQGVFPASAVDATGLGEARDQFHREHLDDGRVGFLETGILHAHWLSTVSRTYAREIQTAEHGMGLEDLLRARSDHLVGIVNGVDYGEWSPDVDPHIAAPFGPDDLSGKRVCRDALLDEMNLAPNPSGPVIGIVSRMTSQKGFELLPDILPVILEKEDVRLCVLGSGDPKSERYFQWLRDAMPNKVGVYFGYKNELSHRIEAGADLFLMPSRYEPCGLNQMYSLRYGTVPLVRATGGLADTVERWDPERREGTGFRFYEFSSSALHDTLNHALDVWRDKEAWSAIAASRNAPRLLVGRPGRALRRPLRRRPLRIPTRRHLMHVIFVEPSFPRNQREFVRALRSVGASVTAIGEGPVEALDGEVKGWLSGYERVPSVTNGEAMLDAVKRIQGRGWVDRLETTVEAHIMACAWVREQAQIPGTSTRTAYLCRDKPAMKETLREAGVATARSAGANTPDEARAFANEVGYPVILKPRDGAGAAGTCRANDDDGMEEAIAGSGLGSGASVAIEEFVEGHEGFWDTLTAGGEVVHEFISHYYPNVLEAMRERWISPQIVATNCVEDETYDEVRALGRKVLDVMGVETSATHMEWFFGPKGLKFSEIGCRPPGGSDVGCVRRGE